MQRKWFQPQRRQKTYNMSSREEILNKLRAGKSLHRPSSIKEPNWDELVFPYPENLVDTFVSELTQIFGKVTLVNNEAAFIAKLQEEYIARGWKSLYCLDKKIETLLKSSTINLERDPNEFLNMEVAITPCEYLVARSGTLVISSAGDSGRRLHVYPPIHLVYATASQLVPFLIDAIKGMESRYENSMPSIISFVTGASRTADIEKTLVMGAHGPKELHVFLNLELG